MKLFDSNLLRSSTVVTTNKFPTLYSKNVDGSIQQWEVSTKDNNIIKRYGRVGGIIQEEVQIVKTGKNKGKKNETTLLEQTEKEALAFWTKKKKEGYVEDINSAKVNEVDSTVIAGGIEPMLAHKFRDHSHKIKYPAYIQPKLDGIRCVAIYKDKKCTLWTRTRKLITSVPHIESELERQLDGKGDIILDGELYNHSLKNEFEKIVSAVRKEEPSADSKKIQYYIYDLVSEKSFANRSDLIGKLIINNEITKVVPTNKILVEDEIEPYFNKYRQEGYEGAIVRNASGEYQNKRSYNLQKVKEFDDNEFEIVSVTSGKGRMEGKAIFICKIQDKNFNVKMEGSLEKLEEIYNSQDKVIGKKLTVRYQGLTSDGIPRFPVGVSIRDYE